jgi:hypothetical protein
MLCRKSLGILAESRPGTAAKQPISWCRGWLRTSSFILKRFGDRGKPNYSHMPQKTLRKKKRVYMSICASRVCTMKNTAICECVTYIPIQFIVVTCVTACQNRTAWELQHFRGWKYDLFQRPGTSTSISCKCNFVVPTDTSTWILSKCNWMECTSLCLCSIQKQIAYY